MSIAAYCENGHLVGVRYGSPRTWRRDLELEIAGRNRFKSFCAECGAPVIERCPHCKSRFEEYANHCVDCGKRLPWVERCLQETRTITDTAENLSDDEKAEAVSCMEQLTVNSPTTAVTASRLMKLVNKATPAVGTALLEIAKAIATAEAKKWLHLG